MLQAAYQLPRLRRSSLPSSAAQAAPRLSQEFSLQKEVIETVNKELVSEAAMWRAKCEEQQECIDCMAEQVRHYNPHNVRHRDKRKEIKLKEQKEAIKELTKRQIEQQLHFRRHQLSIPLPTTTRKSAKSWQTQSMPHMTVSWRKRTKN